ncbi:MAG TPA: hypothetical protein VHN79_06700 [Lacunisphaera sp.]|nr:hypothetical protein [Lacunisphaera sp.]
MKYRRLKLMFHLALLGCASVLMAWSAIQWRQIAADRMEIRRLGTARIALEADVAQLGEPQIEVVDANPGRPGAQATSADFSGAAPRRNALVPTQQGGTARRMLPGSPALQKLFLEAERASLMGRYAAFVRLTGLEADEAARLEELIFQRNERQLDLDQAARLLRLEEHDPALRRTREETVATFRAKFVERFGERAFEAFNEYERALPAWELVNRFAGAAALAGEPLAPAQAANLAGSLAAASPPYRQGGAVDTSWIEWPTVWTEAESILSGSQHLSFLNLAPIYRVTSGGGGLPSIR